MEVDGNKVVVKKRKNIRTTFEGSNRFDMSTGKAYINGVEVPLDAYSEWFNLPFKEREARRAEFANRYRK